MLGYLASPELVLGAAIVGGACALTVFSSWVRGLQLLILAILFGGIIGARLGNTALPIVFRDVTLVLPLYVAFAFSKAGRDAIGRVPLEIAAAICLFLAWLLFCALNSTRGSGLQLLIGLKVWTFYLPFLLVGIALASRPHALFATFRALLVFGLVAIGVGLFQGLLVRLIGYVPAMTLFFGTSAASVTQGFTEFDVGGGIYRIPATFSFGSQYVAFLFLFVTIAIIETNIDPKPLFQRLGHFGFYIGTLAGLFSGTKGAFLMFPLYVLAFAGCGLIRSRMLIAAPIAIAVAAWTFSAANLDPVDLVSFGAQQAEQYGENFIVQQVADATRHGAIGEGIGTSTGAARFAAQGSETRSALGFESYFAKSAAELGTIGLIIVSILLIVVAIRAGTLAVRHLGGSFGQIVAPLAIYIAYVLVTSLKGYPLDIDPANIFFWLSVGLVAGMGRNAELVATASVQRDAAPVPRPAGT